MQREGENPVGLLNVVFKIFQAASLLWHKRGK
jgi:hypothetical protein